MEQTYHLRAPTEAAVFALRHAMLTDTPTLIPGYDLPSRAPHLLRCAVTYLHAECAGGRILSCTVTLRAVDEPDVCLLPQEPSCAEEAPA